jgi:hypothetical protein
MTIVIWIKILIKLKISKQKIVIIHIIMTRERIKKAKLKRIIKESRAHKRKIIMRNHQHLLILCLISKKAVV